ncbi:hypothetical protein BGZ80_006332 [Entomortierella chlamydospora]|uniref:Karyogamy protein n=1 Tax=Entomortierella chlamydospora TaxID=101097 RepID=A0A9P6T255_9FUNG|nr:hypothetical protein BGZ80_006332 [Entomortierella chlamydospora]
MAAVSLRLDGLSEVTELESIPLPYKTLYHTLVFKNEMPIDLLRERRQTGSEQLMTWIKAALKLLESVSESQQYQQRQQLDEDEDEELEAEIQDVVSGFGQYEPTIESSIQILVELEKAIAHRSSSSSSLSSSAYDVDEGFNESRDCLTPEMEILQERWSHLRGIIGDLTGSVREHQRLRDGIQSVRNTSELAQQAIGILEKCLKDIASDRKRTAEIALAEASSRNNSTSSLGSNDSTASLRARAQSSGVDSNDMLELDSRIGLLMVQIDALQKTYPECTRSHRSHRKSRSIKQQETGSIAEKKQLIYKLFKELCKSWHSLRTRRDQLWRDLEECDRWRTRIEKMAKQIETMLEPVEVFHRMCLNLLTTLNGQVSTEELSAHGSQLSLTIANLDITDAGAPRILRGSNGDMTDEPVDLELLSSTLQELDEKQNTVAPAIENMFWVQEGEIQHRTKTAPTTPTTAHSQAPHSHQFPPESTTSVTPPSSDTSPMYPSLDMLERQRNLKSRWSNLKTSLDTVGTKLHAHHAYLKEKANLALKKEEPAEDKTLIGSGNSVDGGDWTSATRPTSPTLRRSMTSISQKSTLSTIPPNWSESSNRFLRGKLVSSISTDSPAVKKFMLVKSDAPALDRPRPWCPSVSTSSPSMPGFPLQTSTWGYFILSPGGENGEQIIATPAPLPVRPPTPPKPEPPKINRPPFSPGGNRRYTSLSKPPPSRSALPSRSASVAGYNHVNKSNASVYMTASGDAMEWTQTLRRSTSSSTVKPMVFASRSHNANASTTSFASSKPRRSFTTDPRTIDRRQSISVGSRRRSESISSNYTIQSWKGHELAATGYQGQQYNYNNGDNYTSGNNYNNGNNYTNVNNYNNGNNYTNVNNYNNSNSNGNGSGNSNGNSNNNKANNGRMSSLSSISDTSEDGTIMGTTRHNEHVGVRAMFTKNSSTSSVDSMLSDVSSSLSSVIAGIGNTFGPSMASSLGGSSSNARSPSPYNNMFGSSFAAARSSAALHSAYMASMSSSSSASLKHRSNSSLSGCESRSRSRQEQGRDRSREHISKIVGGMTPIPSASSWMSSMNTGSILSALSFTVPTYNGADT